MHVPCTQAQVRHTRTRSLVKDALPTVNITHNTIVSCVVFPLPPLPWPRTVERGVINLLGQDVGDLYVYVRVRVGW